MSPAASVGPTSSAATVTSPTASRTAAAATAASQAAQAAARAAAAKKATDAKNAADPYRGLTGDDRDAYVALTSLLKQYGLESLAPTVLKFIREGYTATTINTLLQDTPAYKQRFAANDTRRKAGLPVLSPADYLATESAYRQVMSSAGLPRGFYDQPSDFTKWLEDDVAPQEVQQRVSAARELTTAVDPAVRAEFRKFYSDGEILAYALDRTRAADVLAKQVAAAQIGAAGSNQGVGVDRYTAERLADQGITGAQAQSGFGTVARLGQSTGRLAALEGESYGTDDALDEVFFDDSAAATQRRNLASAERGKFGGSSKTTATSLSARQSGQL